MAVRGLDALKVRWGVAAVLLLSSATPAAANPVAQVAAAVQGYLLAGLGACAVLAVMVVGYYFLTGREALTSVITVVIGLLMLFSVDSIIGAAAGGSFGALAGQFRGWLRAGVWAVLTIVMVMVGYMYWFGKGSYQIFFPVLLGLVIVLSADWLVTRL